MEALVKPVNHIFKTVACPKCSTLSKRNSLRTRRVRDIGERNRPLILEVTYSVHRCKHCNRFFNNPHPHIAPPSCRYTTRVVRHAVEMRKRGLSLEKTRWEMRRLYFVDIPESTLHDMQAMEESKWTI